MNLRKTRNEVRIRNTESALESTATPLSQEIYNLPGLTSPRTQTFLNKISKDKNVLEIGTFCGACTIAIASSAKSVVTVDNWENQETVAVLEDYQHHIIDPKAEFFANIKGYNNIEMISGDIISVDVMRELIARNKEKHFDVIFYDASHDLVDMMKFLLLYQDFFRDCILVIDDYNFSDVKSAITYGTENYNIKPVKEYLIPTNGESKDHFWNGIAVQIFED